MEIGKLISKSKNIAPNEVEIFLSHLLQKDRSFIKAFPEFQLNDVQREVFADFIKRRAKGEPLAYILGYQDFFDLRLKVDRRVLIPRPETENLVLEVIKHVYSVPNRSKANGRDLDQLIIADVGTGSGNIAIALAKAVPMARVIATDIDPEALNLAEENIRRYQLSNQINLVLGHLIEPINQTVDIIVANLPYIPKPRLSKLQKEIRKFEPQIALDGGKDGLALYRQLFTQAKEKLATNGRIFYEVDGRVEILHHKDL
jgi:release factor glutamine methyltransferase